MIRKSGNIPFYIINFLRGRGGAPKKILLNFVQAFLNLEGGGRRKYCMVWFGRAFSVVCIRVALPVNESRFVFQFVRRLHILSIR